MWMLLLPACFDADRRAPRGVPEESEVVSVTFDPEDPEDAVEDTGTAVAADPTPNVLEATVSQNGDAIELTVTIDDGDGDLSGGTLAATVAGITASYSIPDDFVGWTSTPTGAVGVVLADASVPACGSVAIDVEVVVTDAAAHPSATYVANAALVGWGIEVSDLGDDWDAATDIGTVSSGTVTCGSLSSTGNNAFDSYEGDNDYWSFSIDQVGSWDVRLSWAAGAGDYDLYVYDAYGVEVGSSYTDGTLQPEIVSVYLYKNEAYVARVVGWSGPAGAWSVSLTR